VAYYALLLTVFILLLRKFAPLISLLTSSPTHSILPSVLLTDPKIRNKPELIPRIIHQTWKNETIPWKWRWTQGRTRNMTRLGGEGWEYMVPLLSSHPSIFIPLLSFQLITPFLI
jgi:hypothetical protein